MGIIGDQISNSKLMVEGLTPTTNTAFITHLFDVLPGFKDVNHIVQKQVAFIDFDTDDYAGAALQKLNGFTVTDFASDRPEQITLKISFAKR